MKEVKKIDVWSLAKLETFFGVVIGVFSAIALSITKQDMTLILGYLIGYPIMMFIIGIIGALLYNFYANTFGGLKIELK